MNDNLKTSCELGVIENNTGRKFLPPKNDKNNKNSKQCNNLRKCKQNRTKRNNRSPWPSGIYANFGDSMVNGTDEKWLSQKHGNVKVFHFSGVRIEDINQYKIPIIIRLLNSSCRD